MGLLLDPQSAETAVRNPAITADARLGTFAHYAEQTLVVLGEDLVEDVADGLGQPARRRRLNLR